MRFGGRVTTYGCAEVFCVSPKAKPYCRVPTDPKRYIRRRSHLHHCDIIPIPELGTALHSNTRIYISTERNQHPPSCLTTTVAYHFAPERTAYPTHDRLRRRNDLCLDDPRITTISAERTDIERSFSAS
jgi:hypothetical protein